MDLHQTIINGGYLLDNEHYQAIADTFLINVSSDLESCKKLYSNFKRDQERIELFEKYFIWQSVPERYLNKFFKSRNTSEFFRQTGNVSYSYEDIPAALRCYNLSLCFAPENSPELALAYANRSALFLQINEAELSLCDIILALKYQKIEDKIKSKLLIRKTRCEQILKQNEKGCFVDKEQQGKIFFEENFGKLKHSNNKIKGAEACVDVKFDSVRGRRLVAKENIKAGTSVLIDKPFVTVLDKLLTWDTEHCVGCTKPILGGLVSHQSTFGMYCSDGCMSSHKRLPDPLLQYLHSTSSLHDDSLLAIHVILKSDHFQITTDNSIIPGFINGTYDPSTYNAIYNLVSHRSQYDFKSNDLPLEFNCIFLASLIKELIPDFAAPSHLAALFLRHFESLQYNVLSLCEWRTRLGPISNPYWNNQAKKQQINPITSSFGIGVFPLVALCNHSCDPNAIFVKNNKQDVAFLVTSRRILEGEEICISYKAPFTRMPFQERRNYLLQNYKFLCNCYACEKGLSVEGVEKNPLLLDPTKIGTTGCIDKLMEVVSSLEYVKILVKEERFTEAFKLLVDCSQFLSSNFRREIEVMQICQDLFRRVVVHLIHL